MLRLGWRERQRGLCWSSVRAFSKAPYPVDGGQAAGRCRTGATDGGDFGDRDLSLEAPCGLGARYAFRLFVAGMLPSVWARQGLGRALSWGCSRGNQAPGATAAVLVGPVLAGISAGVLRRQRRARLRELRSQVLPVSDEVVDPGDQWGLVVITGGDRRGGRCRRSRARRRVGGRGPGGRSSRRRRPARRASQQAV